MTKVELTDMGPENPGATPRFLVSIYTPGHERSLSVTGKRMAQLLQVAIGRLPEDVVDGIFTGEFQKRLAMLRSQRAVGSIGDIEQARNSTGAHEGHTLRQEGRCIYCSCGVRVGQGRLK